VNRQKAYCRGGGWDQPGLRWKNLQYDNNSESYRALWFVLARLAQVDRSDYFGQTAHYIAGVTTAQHKRGVSQRIES
jgi:hypothetical protein